MERNPVVSTSIHSVGYELETEKLEIEFKSGEIYVYEKVPKNVFVELMHSDSHGKYFIENIRDQFAYRRLTK